MGPSKRGTPGRARAAAQAASIRGWASAGAGPRGGGRGGARGDWGRGGGGGGGAGARGGRAGGAGRWRGAGKRRRGGGGGVTGGVTVLAIGKGCGNTIAGVKASGSSLTLRTQRG